MEMWVADLTHLLHDLIVLVLGCSY
jgi:hypothetical protein